MANALASSNLTPASHAMGNLPTPNSAEIARLQGQFRMVWRSPDRAAKCPIRCNLRATPHLGVAREVMGSYATVGWKQVGRTEGKELRIERVRDVKKGAVYERDLSISQRGGPG